MTLGELRYVLDEIANEREEYADCEVTVLIGTFAYEVKSAAIIPREDGRKVCALETDE